MSNEERNFVDLMDEMEQHEFETVSNKLSDIKIVLYTLERNFELLNKFIDENVTKEEYVLDTPLSQKMKIKKELYRLLHNYLAAYQSQYEYVKSLRDRRFSDEGRSAYDDLVRQHDIRPTSDFLKTIRNLAHKHALINANTVYSWDADEDENPVKFLLLRDELENWKFKGNYWHPKTDEFLDERGDNQIELINVIEEHHPDLMAFHDDFRDLVMDEYEEEWQNYRKLQDKMLEDARDRLGTNQ